MPDQVYEYMVFYRHAVTITQIEKIVNRKVLTRSPYSATVCLYDIPAALGDGMGLESDIKEVGKVIAWPFDHAAKLIELIDAGMKDAPAAKAAVIGLIQKGESLVTGGAAVGTEVAAAAASDGTNIAADAAAVGGVEVEAQNAESFWAYFKGTFIPEVEAIYKDVEQIVDGAPAVTTTTTTTTTVA